MAKLSNDGKSVTVEKGDTLTQIAVDYAGGYSKYKQLAAINDISNPNLIYVGQVIKLTSGGSTPSTTKANSNAPTIKQFGLLSNADNVLFATWTWPKTNTKSYQLLWTYHTGDGVWLKGDDSEITVDSDYASFSRQSTYTIPSNARKVQFKVKPISKTYEKNGKETTHWKANWSAIKTWTDSTPLETPDVPSVEIKKYKLTADLENIDIKGATGIEFQVVKNNSSSVFARGKRTIVSSCASFSCTVDAGAEYKVRCRAFKGSDVSEWTAYSDNYGSIPATPKGITTIRASSETSVYLEWPPVASAETYDIEYAQKSEYFDTSDQTNTASGIESTKWDISGLESGKEYFFRVRAENKEGRSGWSSISSVVIGEDPAAPTTWSSTTTAITGENITLYWVHNSADGSSQTFAELELYVDGVKESYTIENTTDEDEKDKTSTYVIDTASYLEGTTIEWRVRTSGVTKVYGDWSIQRTINVYAPPTLELSIRGIDKSVITTLESFPFNVYALAGPSTQAPIGYHLTITSNDIYETVDNMGNAKTVNEGEEIYSKYFDITDALDVDISAKDIDLENNASYTITCVVSMNSGLTAEATAEFSVSWADIWYTPNAEIGIDTDCLTAFIRPYCEDVTITYYKVAVDSGTYTTTSETIDTAVYGELVSGATTTTGEPVYLGTTAEDTEVHYCMVESKALVENVTLSVYRREFDGSFTEIGSDLDNMSNVTVTDPHPSLDYARYRIVAVANDTGAVSYYDVPGQPIGCKAIIIQWNEDWSEFDVSEGEVLEQPPWSGSLLRLPYNVDVSNNHDAEISLVNYIGRKHPVSYYGTQLGETATWNVAIDKKDADTLYALRRLAVWMGDVYVREPSGSGYWASIKVSFSQKHTELTIPVTLDITRVEGGM